MSKRFLRVGAIVLLLINGVRAMFGGGALIAHPDGSSLKMPLYILQCSPFKDFFIPGIILFVMNGLGSLLALLSVLFKTKRSYLSVMAEGTILTGWIIIQVIMIQNIGALHYIFGAIGLLLIGSGLAMGRQRNQTTSHL